MAINENTKNKANAMIKLIRDSNLSIAEQDDLADMINSTLEATNGFSKDEKIQRMSENQFTLARLMAMIVLGSHNRLYGWKEVIVDCKWQLMISVLGLLFLLYFHPELSTHLSNLNGG